MLAERVLIVDRAMGTMIQAAYGVEEEDFRGDVFADHPIDLKGCNENLVLSRSDAAKPKIARVPTMVDSSNLDVIKAGRTLLRVG